MNIDVQVERLRKVTGYDPDSDVKTPSVMQISRETGVNRMTMTRYLNGTSEICTENLIKVAKAYHVSTDYLLGLSDVQSPAPAIRKLCDLTGLSERAAKLLLTPQVPGTVEYDPKFAALSMDEQFEIISNDELYNSYEVKSLRHDSIVGGINALAEYSGFYKMMAAFRSVSILSATEFNKLNEDKVVPNSLPKEKVVPFINALMEEVHEFICSFSIKAKNVFSDSDSAKK